LSVYVKRSIEYSIRLIMELLYTFSAKIRLLKGETNDYGLSWGIWLLYAEKRGPICNLGAYLWVMESTMDFTKKTPSFMSLITSIVFSDSFGGKNLLMKYEK